MINKFGERLRELRLEKGWSQQQMAEALGYKKHSVSNWEVRGKQPDYDVLMEIAKLFNVTTDYLLGMTDD